MPEVTQRRTVNKGMHRRSQQAYMPSRRHIGQGTCGGVLLGKDGIAFHSHNIKILGPSIARFGGFCGYCWIVIVSLSGSTGIPGMVVKVSRFRSVGHVGESRSCQALMPSIGAILASCSTFLAGASCFEDAEHLRSLLLYVHGKHHGVVPMAFEISM
jgi:hypothetical protein